MLLLDGARIRHVNTHDHAYRHTHRLVQGASKMSRWFTRRSLSVPNDVYGDTSGSSVATQASEIDVDCCGGDFQ